MSAYVVCRLVPPETLSRHPSARAAFKALDKAERTEHPKADGIIDARLLHWDFRQSQSVGGLIVLGPDGRRVSRRVTPEVVTERRRINEEMAKKAKMPRDLYYSGRAGPTSTSPTGFDAHAAAVKLKAIREGKL